MDFSLSRLITEKIRIKSNIQTRNYLIRDLREVVKKTNEKDHDRLVNIQSLIDKFKK